MDNLYENNVECIDTYSQFVFMQKKGYKVYYILKRQNPFYEKLRKSKKLKNVIIVNGSDDIVKKAFVPLIFAKNIVTAFCNFNMKHPVKRLTADFFYSDKTINYIYLNHGVTFLKKWVLDYYSPKFYNKLVVSNVYEKEIYKKEAGWRDENLIECGLSRWGCLKKEKHQQKNIFIFFTWRTSFNKNNYEQSLYYKRLISFLTNSRLQKLLSQNNIHLKIAFHHAFNARNIFFEKCENFVHVVDASEISLHIKTADLFITDYSSIVFDFMFLDIPVIFYKLDWDDPKLNKEDIESAYYAMTKDRFLYNCFYYEGDVIDKIAFYIAHGFVLEKEFAEINSSFFYTKNNIQLLFAENLNKL